MTDDLDALVSEDDNSDSTPDLDFNFSLDDSPEEEPADEEETFQRATSTTITTNVTTVDLEKEKFNAFLSILKLLKSSCKDLTIKEGKISQLNDKKSLIFVIDLTSILGNESFMISGIEKRLEILEPFGNQNVDVFLDLAPDGYTFRDSISQIHMVAPIQQYIHDNNEFLEPEQVDSKLSPDISRRIFTMTFGKILLQRLFQYAKSLAANVVRIQFNGDTAKFQVQALDSARSTIIDLATLEDELDDTSIDGLITPFANQAFLNFLNAGIEEVDLEMYHRLGDSNSAMLKITSSLAWGGDDGGEIPITINALGPFTSEDE